MSLLNQVLQDLEKRNVTDKAKPAQASFANITTVPKKPNKPYALVFIILFVLLLGAIGYFIFAKPTAQKNKVPDNIKVHLTIPPVTVQTTNKSTANQVIKPESAKDHQQQPVLQSKVEPVEKESKRLSPVQLEAKETEIKQEIIKPPSNNQQADILFKNAQNQLNLSVKQSSLEQAIGLNPRHLDARLLLSNTLLRQGLNNKAITLLDQSLALFPQNLKLINLRSQLYLQNRQAKAALSLLHAIDINYVQDETFLSLLAAAYQQNNNHQNSLQIYKKLLSINPTKAEYWLGLAIAAEKQNQPEQALNAYQQALEKKSLKPSIVSYIKQRISLLK